MTEYTVVSGPSHVVKLAKGLARKTLKSWTIWIYARFRLRCQERKTLLQDDRARIITWLSGRNWRSLSPTSGREMCSKISLSRWPVCSSMAPTSALERHAPIKSAACEVSKPGPKPIERFGQASRTRVRSVRIPNFWETERPRHPASAGATKLGDINRHYGSEPGTKFYCRLSDQYVYFNYVPISPTESEAVYFLDSLFDHKTILEIEELFTDTGGASNHIFALLTPIGKVLLPAFGQVSQ